MKKNKPQILTHFYWGFGFGFTHFSKPDNRTLIVLPFVLIMIIDGKATTV